ncbi:MAG: methyltransferase domain-containing protein [Candidatus Latescibacteria bacterium]|nr:methyltransferase domain-containing protein [Candidatus Latescibacterota bacterium]NIM20905.1 methyltransferase domain-containing protein [Candidatus Latescibacterota bacterium]NIM65040.1 methyltransferase domain-containing protein [Candidatus Latescibacterota bacterium]NIO01555.1 methyltransferase domain-containing protein [Candidatus Latescibacterota bacterium]NIO28072.1 methyltransferase domain-containing protein [Candidatus Latescibacterota bacterium]
MPDNSAQRSDDDLLAGVRKGFEKSFMQTPLEQQIARCDGYELVPLFERWLPDNQPILEAGCGSGRWVGWFLKHGWEAAGLDWSEALCARARENLPAARFESGDIRAMPFADGEFGVVVSLGSVEHALEGPEPALREFYRVLRPGGIGIISVPFNGPVRKTMRYLRWPAHRAKAIPWLRRAFGKPGWNGRSLRDAKRQSAVAADWTAVYRCGEQGWHFYEYHFAKVQMRSFISRTGFQIIEEFVAIADEGVLQNFGRIAGRFHISEGRVRLSPIGKLLRMLLPGRMVGHMLVYVIRRD